MNTLPKKPVCCGQKARPYLKRYMDGDILHSVECGFRCDKCGEIRIPYHIPGLAEAQAAYMASMEAMAEAGRVFDAWLEDRRAARTEGQP